MKIFRDLFRELSGYGSVEEALSRNLTPISVSGLSGIHRANFISALADRDEKTKLVVTGTEAEALRICRDVNEMTGEETAVVLPAKELLFTSADTTTADYGQMRISALVKIMNGACRVICTGAESLMQTVIPTEVLRKSVLKIAEGDEPERLSEKLTAMGYQRSEKTESPSQYSVRGDILDIFPVQSPRPYRIEFFGDEIDTIAEYDPDTQRRTGESVRDLEIPPADEIVCDKKILADSIEELARRVRGKRAETVREKLNGDAERLRFGESIPNIQKYYPLVYPERKSVFDYIDGEVIFSDYSDVVQNVNGVISRWREDAGILTENGELCRGLEGYYLTLPQIETICESYSRIYLSSFVQGGERTEFKKLVSFETVQNALWSGDMRQLVEDVSGYIERDYRIILSLGSEKSLPIVKSDLLESGIQCDIISEGAQLRNGRVLLVSGSFSGGFEYPENRTVLISQIRSSGGSKRRVRRSSKAEAIRNLSDITEGDLVVHEGHGIGRFIGIKKLEFDGVTKDYITIQYAGTDKLYIPVTQLDMVSRYIGARDDSGVKLSKLSSGEWQRTRNNVRKAVKDMAKELTELYAKREKAKGFAFYPDDEIQHDFEERFPYIETDDQLNAVAEIKADMERARPMERLLCGDVGFGKTEVAFRAVMKCILSGKQCALLAPTTVLAYQHYQTALRRFEHFPVNIELLSRYRTPAQQTEILKKLEQGRIDFLIGTHKIIQKNVKFKDLGLAVIDEEQRFGVAHKEKFKESFNGIDILMLSATPIPRTLNMAMSGIRDMSILEQPPQDRYPVQTYVLEYNTATIAQAITHELRRDGQVYYIHNRIETIERCAYKLKQLFPDANIACAHGQMPEEKMSDIWQKLIEHEVDILVCTSIIETGVDVPNVNTLIIEDSDRFGLSQLYQLRGRVGRSNRRGYAYFTYRRDKVLSEIAEKRLSAMREFTRFGSGFRIAMRDLEIRGAGSILGGSQHGHLEAVGYDMYLKLLSEAVAEERGEEKAVPTRECVVDIKADAYIPENYIPSLSQRIDVYRRIMFTETEEDKLDIIDELIDRYGNPPKSVTGLIEVSILRRRAAKAGITEISQKDDKIYFYTQYLSEKQVQTLADRYKGRIVFQGAGKSYVAVRPNRGEGVLKLVGDVITAVSDSL